MNNATNNRIIPRTSPLEYYEYDAAGDVKKGQGGDAFAYDGENKLVQYQGGATQSGGADYFYDGDGWRVKKVKPSETTIFVYNINGQLVAEYTSSIPANNGTSYLTSDALGSTRVITKADGSVRTRHDYLPFGEELYASTGNRTTGQGYDNKLAPADKTRQKFTQKERDTETGLDYFLARYYSSTDGRFTSADPLYITATRLGNPQQFNLYSYVGNNPMALVDPDGKKAKATSKGQAELKEADRKGLQKDLGKMAPGTKVDASGKIHKPGFLHRMLNRLTGRAKGTELVCRMVDSEKTTTIEVNHIGDVGTFAMNDKGELDVHAQILGTASNQIVSWDPQFSIDVPVQWPDAQGNVTSTSPIVNMVASPTIILGHELIHALNGMNGQEGDFDFDDHSVEGMGFTETVKVRELRDVGFGHNKTGDITENQLRKELGELPRAAYSNRPAGSSNPKSP